MKLQSGFSTLKSQCLPSPQSCMQVLVSTFEVVLLAQFHPGALQCNIIATWLLIISFGSLMGSRKIIILRHIQKSYFSFLFIKVHRTFCMAGLYCSLKKGWEKHRCTASTLLMPSFFSSDLGGWTSYLALRNIQPSAVFFLQDFSYIAAEQVSRSRSVFLMPDFRVPGLTGHMKQPQI